jgi:hypothetical protein
MTLEGMSTGMGSGVELVGTSNALWVISVFSLATVAGTPADAL